MGQARGGPAWALDLAEGPCGQGWLGDRSAALVPGGGHNPIFSPPVGAPLAFPTSSGSRAWSIQRRASLRAMPKRLGWLAVQLFLLRFTKPQGFNETAVFALRAAPEPSEPSLPRVNRTAVSINSTSSPDWAIKRFIGGSHSSAGRLSAQTPSKGHVSASPGSWEWEDHAAGLEGPMVLPTCHVTSLKVTPLAPSGNLRGIQVRAGYAGLENRVSVSFSPPPDLWWTHRHLGMGLGCGTEY